MWAVPSRLVFTFSSTFLSFFSLRSSMYFKYTLAFSMGLSFSPPDTSIVTRDVGSAFPVCALASGSGALCARAPPQRASAATRIWKAVSTFCFILERNLSSTHCHLRSSVSLRFLMLAFRGAMRPVRCLARPLENTSKCPALTVSLCSCNFLKNLLARQSRSLLHLQPLPPDSLHLSPYRQAP